jgi:hypothetical protein
MEEITMGVRYQTIGDPTANAEARIYKRHWVLVFTGEEHAVTIEANMDPGEQQNILIERKTVPRAYHAFRLGTFHGEWSDLRNVLRAHPQINTVYSPEYNNCQHFVAIYLLFLNAFAKHAEGRYFIIDNGDRYAGIKKTLNMSEDHVWNNPNMYMVTLGRAVVAGTTGAAGAAVIAAEATTAVTVPAGGIMGWLGVTNVVVVPAAYATFAAVCVPIAVGLVGLKAASILKKRKDWKLKTLFDNPMILGYPLGDFPDLSIVERPIEMDNFDFLLNNSNTIVSMSMASATIAQRYHSNPTTAPGASNPSDLFRLAGQLIR